MVGEKKLSILFLDIDGVCNHNDWYYENRVVKNNFNCGDIDPKVVERLNSLGDLDVKVVISSSLGADADRPLLDAGLKLPIIGHTEHFRESFLVRGNEIKKWIEDFDHVIKQYDEFNYLILDDDTDMLMEQEDHFVFVDSEHGLTDELLSFVRWLLSDDETEN